VSAPTLDELEARLQLAQASGHSDKELVDALNELAWTIRQKDAGS